MGDGICVTDGCNRPVHIRKRGLCKRCYAREYARGFADDPSPRHTITREQWDAALVDCSICGPATAGVIRKVSYGDGRKMICVEGTRAARRRMFYGIELGQLEALLDRQGGVCAVCDRPLSLRSPVRGPQPDTACLDHDHACCPGKRTCGLCVRGLLCVGCNVKVGYWERGQGAITERGSEYLQNGPVDFAAFS